MARWHLPIKKIVPLAIERGFTALLIINEDQKKINRLILSHLPSGPTITFRMTNVFLRRELRLGRRSRGIEDGVIPHVIMTRFMTRLGIRTERILGAIFPNSCRSPPEKHSRTLVFHNQRDYIFFRHYRYIYRNTGTNEDKNGDNEQIVMNEVGPRFTLKLLSIQLGTFDSQFGDFEWVRKRTEVGTSRRTFVL